MDFLQFFKMSGCGNDFILIDNRDGSVDASVSDMAGFVAKGVPKKAFGRGRWSDTYREV